MVTDDYIEIAISEIQVFNRDPIPITVMGGSVNFVTNVFHKWWWKRKPLTLRWFRNYSPLRIHFKFGMLCKRWGKHHIIHITWGSFSLWRKIFSVCKLPLQSSLGRSTVNTGFQIYIAGSYYLFVISQIPSLDSLHPLKCLAASQKEFIESGNFG